MRGGRQCAVLATLLLAMAFSGCGEDEASTGSLPSADELIAMLPAEVETGNTTTELSHLESVEIAAGDAELAGEALDVSPRERDISASDEFAEAIGLDQTTATVEAYYGFSGVGLKLAAVDYDFDEMADALADLGGWERQGDDLLVRRPEGLEGPFEAIGRIDDGVLGFAERAKAIQAIKSTQPGKSEATAVLARIDGPLRNADLYSPLNTRYYPGGCVGSFAVADGLDGTGEVVIGIGGEAPRPREVAASTLRSILEDFGPYKGLQLGSASAEGKSIRVPFEYAEAKDPTSVYTDSEDIAYGDFGC